MCRKLFGAGKYPLPGKAVKYNWFQGPTFREAAKYLKTVTYLCRDSEREKVIWVLRGDTSCPEIDVPS